MNQEDLYRAVNEISDDLIMESEKKRRPFAKILVPLAAAATAFAIGVTTMNTGYLVYAAEIPDSTNASTDPEEYTMSEEYYDWLSENSENVYASREIQDSLSPFYQSVLKEFLENEDSKNQVFSPLNIYFALAMTAEIADGNTRQQILDVLNVSDIEALEKNVDTIWNANYADTPIFTSKLASSIWLNDEVSYHKDVLKTLASVYKASSYSGDPGNEKYDEALQDWLNENTGHLLEDYAKNAQLPADTVIALASALYYKASWMDEFDSSLTDEETFHGADGDETVSMMHQSKINSIYQGENYIISSLSLTDSGNMVFVLPDEGTDIETVLDRDLYSVIHNMNESENTVNGLIHYSIPKFDVSNETDLITGLKDLGITDAFEDKADFSPLSDTENVCITSANHSARLLIDEDGVTGAAYTIMMTGSTGGPIEYKEYEFKLDRPFIFMVTGSDGSILFAGVIQTFE